MSHRRTSSSDSDPYDTAENYYGSKTNPSSAANDSRIGRLRTLSMVEMAGLGRGMAIDSSDEEDEVKNVHNKNHIEDTRSQSALDGFHINFKNSLGTLKERNSDSSDQSPNSRSVSPENSNPAQEEIHSDTDVDFNERRPSIVPLYGDFSQEELAENNAETEEKLIPDAVQNHIKKTKSSRKHNHTRRASMDNAIFNQPRKFYISNIDATLDELLRNEDTDNNCQITIEDTGPKVLPLGTANSNGYNLSAVRGTYMLSNLLQELTIAKRMGRTRMILDERRLNENPVLRLRRLITTSFWKSLTRQVNEENIAEMARDTKIVEQVIDDNGELHCNPVSHRIYVPHERLDQYNYFLKIKEKSKDVDLDVQLLPEVIDADFIKSINKKPGLLSLASKEEKDGNLVFEPYVVPGGRFNELYGWDSYMETLGLLVTAKDNTEHLRLARGMAENFIYEIRYYGKILNANRSYYLGRSQPPFLTDMALRIYDKTMEIFPEKEKDSKDFLYRAIQAAIKEYETVWVAHPRFDAATGLSCYHPIGKGIPPETESTHFDSLLEPFIKKHNISKEDFIQKYNDGEIKEPELDEYFLHDRAVRESGHDTSYRLEGKCAYLATVDLNALLYKYEVDIAEYIEKYCENGKLIAMYNGMEQSVDLWKQRAQFRRKMITKYLWNEEKGAFYDYNVKDNCQMDYDSATTFWPLWSKAATEEQAAQLVEKSVCKFEEYGGLVSGTEKSRGVVGLNRPSRQWDYPFGWAPQQILAWIGFSQYGYEGVSRRLAYRWLYLMTQAFVDFNGIVVEKYDVTSRIAPHKVTAEYGNQGSGFKGVATEGFGWVNASYVYGLTYLPLQALRNLGTLTPPNVFLKNLNDSQLKEYSNEKISL